MNLGLVATMQPSEKSLYTIGEATEMTGFSARIIHLHEERGLIKTSRRSQQGHRYLDQENIARLNKIKQLQLIGLSLDEIASVIHLYFEAGDFGVSGKQAALKILHQHLHGIETQQQALNTLHADIIRSIARLELLLQQAQQQHSNIK